MTPTHATNVGELWVDLIDRDLETLVAGRTPANDDLAPLGSFVSTLKAFGSVEPSEEFVKTNSVLSAASARELRASTDRPSVKPGGTVMFRIRRRAAALATSLVMISGMTGMALAADGAAPGDWNYGIAQALEAVGIGAGASEERLQELEVLKSDDGTHPQSDEIVVSATTGTTGHERAAQVVAANEHGSQRSTEVRNGVALLLDYLTDTEAVDRLKISELAKAFAGKPDIAGKSDHTGKPGTTGKPDHAGKP